MMCVCVSRRKAHALNDGYDCDLHVRAITDASVDGDGSNIGDGASDGGSSNDDNGVFT